MRRSLPADLLLRLLHATPEQFAAVEKILGSAAVPASPTHPAPPALEITETEAARVFRLVKLLEADPIQRKAPLLTVFRLLVLEGLSQRAAARRCGCVPALVSLRVRTLEARFGMSIVHLRGFASALVDLEASVKGDRARRKSRGAANVGPADSDADPEELGTGQDDDTCASEEGPDDA